VTLSEQSPWQGADSFAQNSDERCRSRGGSFDFPLKGEHTMQYMLMIYYDEERWAQVPEAQREKIMQDSGEFRQGIVMSGHFRGGAKLQPTSMATTVREQHGKRVITDGPCAETKVQLGGFLLIECKDLDEAISIAARFPMVRLGGAIEVRPVVPPPAW
jgi:hypothetical protein